MSITGACGAHEGEGGDPTTTFGKPGHTDPEVHAAPLKAYDKWDTVMMPIHVLDRPTLEAAMKGRTSSTPTSSAP